MNNDILLSTKFKSIGEDATVSMPSQIKALFGMNPQIDVRLIDYDYIGDAKDDDYTSFAEKLYKANPNAHYILVTHSNELKDSLLVRKTFHFDLTGFYFSEEIQTWSVPISNNTIVFLGVIEIETFVDGIYAFKGMGPHFPRQIFVYKGGRLFIFNSRGDYNPEGVIAEFCSCIKTLNLTHKEIVDYLNVICLYLQAEAETDYGDTIK